MGCGGGGEGEEREAAAREPSQGEFQPASLHPAGPFGELRSCRAGLRGRGRPRAAQVCPGAPRGLRGLLPPSCPLPAGLWRERKTHLISEIGKHVSDNVGCNFASVQKALKSLRAAEQ